MLIQEGESRNVAVDVQLASILAAIAGAINMVGFHSVGYYSANMTGNVSALSDAMAVGNWPISLLLLGIVMSFISGAWTAGLMINYGRRRQVRAIYAVSILTEGVLLAGIGLADLYLPALQRSIVLVLGLSFLMGLQNAAATRISNGRVRTTHVSGMATDIGIEMATLFDIGRGKEPASERRATESMFRLHGMTILSFIFGGTVAALFYDRMGGLLLMATAALLIGISLRGIRKARKLSP